MKISLAGLRNDSRGLREDVVIRFSLINEISETGLPEAGLGAFVDVLRVTMVGSGLHRVSELLRKVVAPVPFLAWQISGHVLPNS
jgi:hypothetical protein